MIGDFSRLEYGTPQSNAGYSTIPLTTKMQEYLQKTTQNTDFHSLD